MKTDEKMNKVKGDKLNDFPSGKNVRILPTFSMTEDDLPEIKDWKVGSKYTVIMEVEMIEMRQGSSWQGANDTDKKARATFKITDVGVEEEDYATEYARKRSKAAS